MPQDSMFDDQPRYGAYRLEWEQVVEKQGVWYCTLRRRELGKEEWTTVHRSVWSGAMMDYASTMAEDCQNAFLYDDSRGLGRAATAVVRLARIHERRYSGF